MLQSYSERNLWERPLFYKPSPTLVKIYSCFLFNNISFHPIRSRPTTCSYRESIKQFNHLRDAGRSHRVIHHCFCSSHHNKRQKGKIARKPLYFIHVRHYQPFKHSSSQRKVIIHLLETSRHLTTFIKLAIRI